MAAATANVKLRIHVTDNSPVPMAPSSERRATLRRTMESTILTSSPHKRKLSEDVDRRSRKVRRLVQFTKESEKKIKTSKQARDDKKAKAFQRRLSKNAVSSVDAATSNDDSPCGWCGQKFYDITGDRR